jgi:uncharacterized glyoxalase superfamily protein PhnB
MEIPDGHQGVMPYLMMKDSAAFLDFVEKVFDAESTYKAVNDDGSLGHCEVRISGSTIMFSNSRDEWEPATANMFVYVENADETYDKALKNGATTVMPPADQEYGRSGGVTDPHGNVWWITSVL